MSNALAYNLGYSDGRAGRDSWPSSSDDRDEYLRGFILGDDDRRKFGWA